MPPTWGEVAGVCVCWLLWGAAFAYMGEVGWITPNGAAAGVLLFIPVKLLYNEITEAR